MVFLNVSISFRKAKNLPVLVMKLNAVFLKSCPSLNLNISCNIEMMAGKNLTQIYTPKFSSYVIQRLNIDFRNKKQV